MLDRIIAREIEVTNTLGLHAVPCFRLLHTATQFKAQLRLRMGDQEAWGGGDMGMMSLGAGRGTRLTLIAEGPDESAVMEAVAVLFASKFGED